MRIARHVVQRSKQLLVPVPRQVRDHLGLVGTVEVWWHIQRKGEVALTVTGTRGRGPVRGGADCTACASYRKEIEQLEARLRAAPEVALRQFRMQEWLARFRVELRGLPVLGAINDRLGRIEDKLGTRRGPWGYTVKPGAARRARGSATDQAPSRARTVEDAGDVSDVGVPDQTPPPEPLPAPVVVEQGADTSGAPPPGVPPESDIGTDRASD